MKLLLEALFLLVMISAQLFSQTEHDTSKILSNKKIMSDEKKKINTRTNNLDAEGLSRLEFQHDNFKIPLNLKIYQKIFAYEKFETYNFPQDYLNSGLSNNELMIFDRNKMLTKRMLTDIYGEDIIDLKKILETLGITKDQIVMFVAILKFLLYSPAL